ncbi:PPE domain-containing protein [Nocardia sp. NPDC052566]|uniref:PPE domain-containing protein n=1 Tax=Nocardia sp. NPDC052566 TaxID=3364330 RepID=UPI0037C7A3CF
MAESEWPGLDKLASSGFLRVDDTVAVDCANQCAELVAFLLGIKKAVGDNKLDRLDQIGTLSSGRALSGVFSGKGRQLAKALEAHVKLLADMADAFKVAGRAYAQAERDSIIDLSHVRVAYTPSSIEGKPGKAEIPSVSPSRSKSPDVPDSMSKFKGSKDSPSIMPDNPDFLTWRQLHDLGRSIRAQPIADAGGAWSWLAKSLYQQAQEFVNNLTSIEDRWEGDGAEAAIAAARKYGTEVKALTEAMVLMGDNLMFTAGWLDATRRSMPPTPEPPEPAEVKGYWNPASQGWVPSHPGKRTDQLPMYREYFKALYVGGMNESTSEIPVIVGPASAKPSAGEDKKPEDKKPEVKKPVPNLFDMAVPLPEDPKPGVKKPEVKKPEFPKLFDDAAPTPKDHPPQGVKPNWADVMAQQHRPGVDPVPQYRPDARPASALPDPMVAMPSMSHQKVPDWNAPVTQEGRPVNVPSFADLDVPDPNSPVVPPGGQVTMPVVDRPVMSVSNMPSAQQDPPLTTPVFANPEWPDMKTPGTDQDRPSSVLPRFPDLSGSNGPTAHPDGSVLPQLGRPQLTDPSRPVVPQDSPIARPPFDSSPNQRPPGPRLPSDTSRPESTPDFASGSNPISQLGSNAAQALQSLPGLPKSLAGMPGAADPAGLNPPDTTRISPALSANARTGGGGLSGGVSGDTGPGLAPQDPSRSAALFPRASVSSSASVLPASAAPGAETAGTPGMPMSPPMGAPARAQDKEYKRPKYLNSAEHLEDALGPNQVAIRPVIEPIPAAPVEPDSERPPVHQQQPGQPRVVANRPPRPTPQEPVVPQSGPVVDL